MSKKALVGAIIDRPHILQRKICRRKAKILSFSFGKSENFVFRRAINDRPYIP